ncbi:MAG: aspartate-semialdehyde dehydrogenase [Pseudomonadota bacterium]
MTKKIRVAVLGATGLVGQAMLDCLIARNFPVDQLYPLATANSAGETIQFGRRDYEVLDAETFDFSKADLAFFTAGADASRHFAPRALAAGCRIVDNTSAFRMDKNVPLVIPEINADTIHDAPLIANPNCATIQLLMALYPIDQRFGISEVVVSTYQSVSGVGRSGVEALAKQSIGILNSKAVEDSEAFPAGIAFNVIPQIGTLDEQGYSEEEEKLYQESRKILDRDDLSIHATAVRVPTFFGHAESVFFRTAQPCDAAAIETMLSEAAGIKFWPHPSYPMPRYDALESDEVHVGRLRAVHDDTEAFSFWSVTNNVQKGAALNSIQIAEVMFGVRT